MRYFLTVLFLVGVLSCKKNNNQPPAPVPKIDTINEIQLDRYYDGQAGINYLSELEFDKLGTRQNGTPFDTIIKVWRSGMPGPDDTLTYTVYFQYLGSVPLLNIDSLKSSNGYLFHYAPNKDLLNNPIFRVYQCNGDDTTVLHTYVLVGGGEITVPSVEYLTPHANADTLTAAYNSYLTFAYLAALPWLLFTY